MLSLRNQRLSNFSKKSQKNFHFHKWPSGKISIYEKNEKGSAAFLIKVNLFVFHDKIVRDPVIWLGSLTLSSCLLGAFMLWRKKKDEPFKEDAL